MLILRDRCDDILNEILCNSQPEITTGLEELSILLDYRPVVPGKRKKMATKSKSKNRKATHYISENILKELALAKEKIRALHPSLPKSHVSKSSIVNHALLTIINDFKTNKNKSVLVRRILKKAAGISHA